MSPPPPFSRFVAIDWSGARLPSAQRRAIVRCVVEGPPGDLRVTSLQGGYDRQETVGWLAECAADGVPTLVGLDFPFSYAIPFLDHRDVTDYSALLAHMSSLEAAQTFIDACGKWWSECGDDGNRFTRRGVERLPRTRGAESPLRALRDGNGSYRYVGARQVGKAAITGISAIAKLKQWAPTVRVWPFEDPAGAPFVLAEIWPRLALEGIVKSNADARERYVRALGRQGTQLGPEHQRLAMRSDHAIDALAAAVEMASGRWPVLARSALPQDSVREGWILGVRPEQGDSQPVTSPSARQ